MTPPSLPLIVTCQHAKKIVMIGSFCLVTISSELVGAWDLTGTLEKMGGLLQRSLRHHLRLTPIWRSWLT